MAAQMGDDHHHHHQLDEREAHVAPELAPALAPEEPGRA